MTPRVIVAPLPEIQAAFARVFEGHASEVIARREKFIVALPGGSAARTFLPVLAGLDVDWTRVEIFWIDERAVPPDHPESNYALAARLLLGPARVPHDRIHRMVGELPDLDSAARRAADELKSIAGDPPHLDLALVGVGEDGHVASIFRNRAAHHDVRNRKDYIEPVYDAPKPPARRLTLTLPVLAGAGLVVVAAFGSTKADVMRLALSGSGAVTPIAELLRLADSALVLLDPDAGLS